MKLEDISPIWDIVGDTIISKKGDLSFVFKVEFPEVYILSAQDYNLFNSVLTKAVNMLPDYSIFQRMDFFYPEVINPVPRNDCFIDRSNCKFWGEREVINSETFFIFTKIAKIEKKSYYNSTLNSKGGLFEDNQFDRQEIALFKIAVDEFMSAFTNAFSHPAKKVSHTQLNKFDELYEFVFERYLYLGIDKPRKNSSVEFIDHNQHLQVGEDIVTVISMNADGYPSELLSSIVDVDTEVSGIAALEVSTLHKVGYKLDFPHILVSSIYTLNQRDTRITLEDAIKRFHSLKGSMYNNEKLESISAFLYEITSKPNLKIVEHNFCLVVATPLYDKDLHNKRVSRACSSLADLDIRYTKNASNCLNYFFSCCPGNANDVADIDRGVVLTQHAGCFNIWENNQRSSGLGVRFLDRKFGNPIMVDLWNFPSIENRNMFVVAPSGKGKSFTINHLLAYLLHDKLDAVIVDVGNSYKKHGMLHNAVYIEATETNPLVYNPFLSIKKGEDGKFLIKSEDPDDPDLFTPIITILFKAWRSDKLQVLTPEEYAVFSTMLTLYYGFLEINPDTLPCYNTFHPFFLKEFKKEYGTDYRLFDIGSYKLVMKMFTKGGQFEGLFNCPVNPNYFNSNLVIFELGGIEGNKILFQVTYTLIMQVVMDKMMRQKNKRKLMLFMDEVWKILNTSMEDFIKFMYKTARKHDGAIGVITQEISDILGSSVGKAIIGNSDLKILLQHGHDAMPQLTKELFLTKHQTALAQTIKITDEYRELFIKAGNDIAMVYRIETAPETAMIFTSKKSDNHAIYQEIEDVNDVELAIKNLVERKQPNRYTN